MAVLLLTNDVLAQEHGNLRGKVIDTGTGERISNVTLSLENKLFERTITVDGTFEFRQIPDGIYRLSAKAPGYASTSVSKVEVKNADHRDVTLEMTPYEIRLSEVVVSPSQFSIFSRTNTSAQFIDREEIQNTPHTADDLFRALDTIPGVSTNDYSAHFNIRGGSYREIYVSLDGMELLEPFHLKGMADGVFSIVDPRIIGALELKAGGFAAEHGNALSGVLEMSSLSPAEPRSSLEVSLSGINYRTENTFANGLGSYVFSARRGYLDIVMSIADEQDDEEQETNDMIYWDAFGKVSYALGEHHVLSASLLVTGDSFTEEETENGAYEFNDLTDDTYYTWLKLDSIWSNELKSQTVLSYADWTSEKDSDGYGGPVEYNLLDRHSFSIAGFKQDWEWEIAANHFTRFGFGFKKVDADYDFDAESHSMLPLAGQEADETWHTHRQEDGDEMHAYLSHRMRFGSSVTAELGGRYDRQSVLDDDQFSPRFNLAWQINPSATLRFAWGEYHQAPRIHEFDVESHDTSYAAVESSTHYLLGYEQRFDNGIDLRVEAYHKDLEDVRARHVNLFDPMSPDAMFEDDRTTIQPESGEANGVEFTLKHNLGGKFSWFLNYTWSKAEDDFEGSKIPRPWDQTHCVNANFNYRKSQKWNFNASFRYHTGWPSTPFFVDNTALDGEAPVYQIATGDLYSDNLPAYHRLDLRINRRVVKNGRRGFNFYIDITNLYNRENLSGYEDVELVEGTGGVPILSYSKEKYLPIMPSFGMSWVF